MQRPERRASLPRRQSRTEHQEAAEALNTHSPGTRTSAPRQRPGFSATDGGRGWNQDEGRMTCPGTVATGEAAGEESGTEVPLAPGNLEASEQNRAEPLPAASPDPTQRRLLHPPPSGAQPADCQLMGTGVCLPACLPRAFQTLRPEDALLTGIPSSWGHRGPMPQRDFPAQRLRPVALPSRLEDGRSCSPGVTLHWTQAGSFQVSRPGRGWPGMAGDKRRLPPRDTGALNLPHRCSVEAMHQLWLSGSLNKRRGLPP